MSAVRVAIDGKCLLPPRTGVGRYVVGVLDGLAQVAPADLAVEVLTPSRPRRTLPWVMVDLQRASGRGFSVLHIPFYYGPLAPRCPTVVVVHDLLALEHPEWFRPRRLHPIRLLLPRSARRAAAVVTFSRSVAAALEERLGIPGQRVRVIPHGVDRRIFRPPGSDEVAACWARFHLARPYVLYLGPLEPRRGVDLALAAVANVRGAVPGLELVLVGGVRSPVAALAAAPAWVRRLGHVEDAALPPLLAGAAAVLAPSRGEGFDLPVLEALACGSVVVASDIAPHREHFAEGVALFPSGDAEGLACLLRQVLEDGDRAAALRREGEAVAGRFSWAASARAHVALWREVAG